MVMLIGIIYLLPSALYFPKHILGQELDDASLLGNGISHFFIKCNKNQT